MKIIYHLEIKVLKKKVIFGSQKYEGKRKENKIKKNRKKERE